MDRSAPRMVSLRAAVAMVCATTAVFFAGVFAAHAWPGRTGEARSSFTVAGSLTLPAGATRPPTLRFVFHKSGAADCSVDTRAEMPPTGDQFSAQIDYDACGRGFFDGSDVTADVLVNGAAVVTAQPVNPVPYAHFASVAGVARQYETPDCPMGYTRDRSDATLLAGAGVILCRKGRDEVVRVGDGAAAFWIDRNEATIWNNSEGTGTRVYNTATEENLETFGLPRNGLWLSAAPAGTRPRASLYAASVRLPGSHPSRWVTWFQANALCRASGKRLPTGDEWLLAAQGTPDDPTRCNTGSGAIYNLDNDQCFSLWGAEDMVGNLWEWTAEWQMGVGDNTFGSAPWPVGYGGDGTWNITSTASSGLRGVPSAARRGGSWENGAQAGTFALSMSEAPSAQSASQGFRCVIPR